MNNKICSIVLTKWGLSMREGTVQGWLKEEGSQINIGDPLVEIETEKIVNEYESPEAGKLRKIISQQGEKLPIGSLIAVLAEDDVSDAEINNYINSFQKKFSETLSIESIKEGINGENIKIEGKIIHFLKAGHNDENIILFIHGFGADLNTWAFNQGVLSEKYTTYSIDLPGHGGSYKNINESNIESFSKLVTDFCKARKISNIHLVGQSMGGGISLSIALKYPDLVKSLTLICPTNLGNEINIEYINGFINSEKRKEIKPYLEKLFYNSENITRDMINEVLKNKRMDGAKEALQKIALSFFSNGNQNLILKKDLNKLNQKCVLIWGKNDNIIPFEHSNDVSSSIEIHLIDNAGHMAHVEQSAKVNEIIKKVINSR